MMIGRPLSEYFPAHIDAQPGDELLRVEGLSCPGMFQDVSFTLRAGEVVGLAGLVGAGRSELAQAIFGLQKNVTGKVFIRGKEVRIRTPKQAIRLGIGLVPEDRKRQGLVLGQSGVHNTSLPILDRLSRFRWIRQAAERLLTREFFDKLRVRAPGIDAPVAGLSGGNQQKIVLAKWLAAESHILILDEPTRGVDVGAKAEIHALIDRLAEQGNAVLLISSELPEVISLSSRILVLREGRLTDQVSRESATQDRLLVLMAGLEDHWREGDDAAPSAAPPAAT
jgi:ABC-type sugar transport system ATPase subunit